MVSATKRKGGIPLRTRPILAAAALLLAAGLAAVTHGVVSQADEPLRIGTTYMTMNNPFYSVIDEELRLVIESRGDILLTRDPALDQERQNEEIRDLLHEDIDLLVLNPVDYREIEPALREAQKAGVPVVVIDSQVSNPDLVACTIASDNYGAGVLCAEHLMNTCDSAKVVLIEHASTKSGMDRIQGFCDTLASHPDFQIIGRADSAGQLEVAMPQMDRLLEQGIVPDAVMCLNDPSALGAMAALQEHGLLEKTTVYGVDGAPEAKSMISEDAMTATAAQSPIRLGQITAQTVYAILNGEDYEKEITVPVELVTKDNVNGYDMDGVAFAQNLSALPAKPWTLTIAVLGMAALILAGVLRRRGQNFIGWIEPLFALCVIFALHLAYNGLLLYVVVDLIDGLHGRTRRRFLGAMTALFLLTGLGALQGALHVVPFSEYLLYFDMHTRQLLQSVVDLLGALHLILFVVYMVVLIGQRTEENSAIRRLNGELEQANDRLSVMNEQLKAYAAESERMAETRERNRLAREIHDTLGHALTGITAGADACIQMLEISPEMAKKQMERIASTAREGMNEVRRSVRALRPDALERMQLTDAVAKLCTEMQTTSQAEITLDLQTEDLRLSPDEEDAVYRIVQESITNAIRHGHATAVRVRIAAEERRLGITVTDNGCGCAKIEPGFGLRHMRERLRLLNGTLKVKSEKGFELHAEIPLRWGDVYD